MEKQRRRANLFQETYDIVGSLPIELVLEITEYLRPADIARNLKVSKRWRRIFSSRAVLHKTLAFLNMENAEVSASEAITYIEWHYRLQKGRPVKKMFLPWSESARRLDDIAYRSRRLCYRAESGVGVETLNLETGEKSIWTVDEEFADKHWGLLMSDQYIVIITGRNLIVRDTKASQRHARQIPVSMSEIFIEKDKVFMVDEAYDPYMPRSIYIWDLSSDHFQKIAMSPDLWLWHLNADENILVAFEIDWDADPPKVQQTKWELTGRLLEKRHFHLPLLSGRVSREILFENGSLLQFGWDILPFGHKTLRYLSYSDPYRGPTQLGLLYDFSIDKFSVRLNSRIPMIYNFFLTPDIVYSWSNYPGKLEIVNAKKDIRERRWNQEGINSRLCSLRAEARDPPARLFFGDSEVFGMASKDGIRLWFFNPSFIPDIPDAEPFPSTGGGYMNWWHRAL